MGVLALLPRTMLIYKAAKDGDTALAAWCTEGQVSGFRAF
jgi:hypothetical protein